MSTTYKGYPIELLMGVKNFGPALVNDPDLYAAAQEYTEASKGGGTFGPALIGPCGAQVRTMNVQGQEPPKGKEGLAGVLFNGKVSRHEVHHDPSADFILNQPPEPPKPIVATESPHDPVEVNDEETPWDHVEFRELLRIIKERKIQRPKTLGKATAIRLLVEAGVTPPS